MKANLFHHLSERIEKSWYQSKWWNTWLLPLSGLFFVITHTRRFWLQKISLAKKNNTIPVVVIGNINVGGTGKTPLACYLVKALQDKGIVVGIISRGYGSVAPYYPYALSLKESAHIVGDEPKLLRDRLNCPVVIGADRNAAIKLLSESRVDLILSDDGLQHYKMARDYEIAVLDNRRQLGNGWLLPAGPLREGAWRLDHVDLTVYNGGDMNIVATAWVNARTGARKPLDFFAGQKVHAVAGIGNPQRFFTTLTELNVEYKTHIFSDHYKFQALDLKFEREFSNCIVMTEKDWVKCVDFATDSMWYLEVSATLESQLEKKLIHDLLGLVSASSITK